MGEKADPAKPGYAFVTALAKLMARTGMDKLAMSDFNINKDDLPKVAHIAAAEVGFECDRYTVTEADVVEILMQSYKYPRSLSGKPRGGPLPARTAETGKAREPHTDLWAAPRTGGGA